MKVFKINANFLLPDDFNGSESDALRLMADYHEKKQKENPSPFEEFNESEEESWNTFNKAITEGKRLHGGLACMEWKESENKWEPINNE